jgi:uncharacterized protein (DUF2141 family)
MKMVSFRPKNAAWPVLVLALLVIAPAVPARAAILDISVTGIRNGNGWLMACVFASARGFPNCDGNRSAIGRRRPASPGTARFDVDVAPGRHAVSVLHDENGNHRLDTNFFGIPQEGGGVSNNPQPRMGPPRFEDAVFEVPAGGSQITVRMVYP